MLELEFRLTVRLNLTEHRARVGIAPVSYSGGPRFEYFFLILFFTFSSQEQENVALQEIRPRPLLFIFFPLRYLLIIIWLCLM
jgi:hypothetical protein